MKKYTVIIADDHPIFRSGVKEILRENNTLELVGEAQDGAEAYNLIVAHRPDLAIMDLEMPLLSGLDVCSKVLSEKNQTQFIVLTMHKEKHFFKSAMEAGVSGYLLKDKIVDVPELTAALQRIADGGSVVDPSLVAELVAAPAAEDPLAELTAREREVLALLAEGGDNAGAANALANPKRLLRSLPSVDAPPGKKCGGAGPARLNRIFHRGRVGFKERRKFDQEWLQD